MWACLYAYEAKGQVSHLQRFVRLPQLAQQQHDVLSVVLALSQPAFENLQDEG